MVKTFANLDAIRRTILRIALDTGDAQIFLQTGKKRDFHCKNTFVKIHSAASQNLGLSAMRVV